MRLFVIPAPTDQIFLISWIHSFKIPLAERCPLSLGGGGGEGGRNTETTLPERGRTVAEESFRLPSRERDGKRERAREEEGRKEQGA